MAKLTCAELRKAVRELDPKPKESDPAFSAAVALLASAYVGASVDRVTKLTGLPRKDVQLWAMRWRSNQVWIGSKVAGEEWLDKESGGASFWLHVCVGLGFIQRGPSKAAANLGAA